MKRLILLSFIFSFAFNLSSANEKILEGKEAEKFHPYAQLVRIIDNSAIPDYFEFKASNRINQEEIISFVTEAYELPNDLSFKLIASETDDIGFTHLFYQQELDGVLIEISSLNVLAREGVVYSFSGSFTSQIPKSRSTAIGEDEALNRCLDHMGANTYKWELKEEEDFLKWEQNDPKASFFPKGELMYINEDLDISKSLNLCYRFNIYSHDPLSRMEYYVDANSNKIVFSSSLIHTGGNAPGRGVSAYSDTVNIIADFFMNAYRLRDSTRGNSVETYDLNTSTSYNSAVDFLDSNNFWNAFNPAIDKYAIDAHWGTEVTYDYFMNVHNWNSIDNAGFALKSYIHYSTNYVNAFWDGQRMTW